MRLPISPSLWLWSNLAPFMRYGDLLDENCLFSYPSLIRRPRFLYSLPNFAIKLTVRKLESLMALSCNEHGIIVAWVIFTWYWTVTDRRTDKQSTDGRTDGTYPSYYSALHSELPTRCKTLTDIPLLNKCTYNSDIGLNNDTVVRLMHFRHLENVLRAVNAIAVQLLTRL